MDSMVSFFLENLFLIILILIAVVSFIVRRKYREKELFEVKGDIVSINPNPALKFSFDTKMSLPIKSVVKVEIVGNRLSLFQKSGNSIDIWVEQMHLNEEIAKAKNVFKNAHFIKVGS